MKEERKREEDRQNVESIKRKKNQRKPCLPPLLPPWRPRLLPQAGTIPPPPLQPRRPTPSSACCACWRSGGSSARSSAEGAARAAPGELRHRTSQLARSDYFLPLMQRATPVDVAMVLSEEKTLAPGWLAFGESGGPAREGDAARVVWRASDVPLAATSAESKVTVSYTPSEVRK